jgi:hypothetical protein
MHHGHMMIWHKHSDLCEVWLCEGVVYHTPGGISSSMATYDSQIDQFRSDLYIYTSECCIQDEQQEVLAQVLRQ